jgi:phenylalanyl-tRNA synthetase beta chain
MKISLSWLKEFVAIDNTPEEVSEILTDIGLEVEKVAEVETIKGGLQGIVIGEVLTKEKHPDADRLNITTVNVGKEAPYQIVCGAPNVEAGQKVVVALPGAILYPKEGDSFKIKASKIRGVESNGMICAEDEIGLGQGHDGIMVLDSSAVVGIEAAKYFNVETDIVYDIGLTPNRADAMSHFGVARDLMVAFKHKGILKNDSVVCRHSVDKFSVNNELLNIEVEVENKEACPRYAGVTIANVTVADSPKWMQERLNAIGVSPINNVVDATNYVLHELGQPLHAFDADVVGKRVIVKTLSDKTNFTTLDEVERELNSEDLMICNDPEPMCIAGVFGGVKSGVSTSTTNIFLESAYFDPVSVRKTAKRHGLNTDASFRFERGIDPNITIYALKRAALLIQEIAGGEIASQIKEVKGAEIADFVFDINLKRINTLIGVEIEKSVSIAILESLEIKILEDKGDVLKIEVPSYRVDVLREADIAEEILRIFGFNNIPLPEKLNTSITRRDKIDKEQIQHMISDLLVSKGLCEAMSNSLSKSAYSKAFEAKQVQEAFNVKMLNPLSSDLDVMRQSMLFGALESVKLNQNFGSSRVRMFEFGKIYHRFESGFNEQKFLAIFLSGAKEPESWSSSNDDVSFYTLKGLVEAVLEKLGILKNYQIVPNKNELLEDGITYQIAKKQVANVAWVGKKMKKHFGLKSDVFYAEINWDIVQELLVMNKVKFKELPKYPSVTRDLSLLIDSSMTFGELSSVATSAERKLLKGVSLFDVYEGDKLPEGKKSYAMRFVIQDESKTLKDKDIDGVMQRIQSSLEQKCNVQLR